jgi:hypothetical protein
MPVIGFDLVRSEPYLDGVAFGETGAYQRIDAVVRYAVDPSHPANFGITDLHLAKTNENGQVCFDGDMTLLLPVNKAKANGALLLEAPNRGHPLALRSFNRAPFDQIPSDVIEPGDGFLMRHGWSIAFVGWQWDVPRCSHRLGLRAPMVPPSRLDALSEMQLRIQPDVPTDVFELTDQHVGAVGDHTPIPPFQSDDPSARLMVRDYLWDEPELIDRSRWCFLAADDSSPATQLNLDGGFEAGRIYDLFYIPGQCPVVGLGLLAFRDFGSFARYDSDSPTHGVVTHTIAHGVSQCGRFLRTLMHLGLNVDEADRQIFDGMFPHVAGARRGEFNHRYGQPSVQPTPGFGNLFPFADEPQTDPQTGQTAGLLDSLRERNVLPKIMYTDTSSEYWRGDASLTHLSVVSGQDIEPPAEVRRYLFSSTQHGPGDLPFTNQSMFGTHGMNWFNVIDYRPLLTHPMSWVMTGVEPSASAYPRLCDQTGTDRAEVLRSLSSISIGQPDQARLPVLWPLDLGQRSARGIGDFPAKPMGDPYPCLVSAVDSEGNEIGGIPMPDVTVPIATHTGFNSRDSDSGGVGQILEYLGSSIPFPFGVSARKDPRKAVCERYLGREDYMNSIREVARKLVSQKYLLVEDIETCVEIAVARFDAVTQTEEAEIDLFERLTVEGN